MWLAHWLYNVGVALSQFANALLLGDPDESISGRLGRAYISGRPKWFVPPLTYALDWVWLALFGEANHAANSIEADEKPHERELWSWIKQARK